ncbi:A/G-specific adenine glycosylase [Microbacter margulisiae]|uniref:Adenine DNA glycosylase n=1 Tax=Microbacter margulisiae TaxID=1350067 RepID=A0A7W5DPZ8_9PORP|nr:A/G-specific adenine glycosylase [Microbacter margulisiae]MBB3186896.1 A/G-specific adenine glycosylase [Microbacter margulisiae]
MNQNSDNSHFSNALINWYSNNKRDLPWRNTQDPYIIWISEIILQQTRVAQGVDYFLRFIQRFPDVKSLAEAREEDVLKYWQGLGYYSRARNLHAAAQKIMEIHGGKFPDTFEAILALPGIGDYTASAIASFSFQLPHAVLDGNVLRFLARYFGISSPVDNTKTRQEIKELADSLLDTTHPDNFNQAIMEFGALQCVPKNPNCSECPFENSCLSLANHSVNQIPRKKTKTPPRDRYFYYLCLISNESIFLQKRTQKDIWHNLYELPLVETDEIITISELEQNDFFKNLTNDTTYKLHAISSPIKHQLSHQTIHANFITYLVNSKETQNNIDHFLQVPIKEVNNYPVSRLTEKFFKKHFQEQYIEK